MDDALQHELTQRLIADYGFKHRGKWLQQGRCPSCGKRELFAGAAPPWVVRCGRESKCAWESTVKELYPDAFEGFGRRHEPTAENPQATADAYMAIQRGFPAEDIRAWYEQGEFYLPAKDAGTPTVRFYLDPERTVWWERLIDNVERIGRKANFRGQHGAHWWTPPEQQIAPGDEVWLPEGIFDAIALHLAGCKVAAGLSVNKYPEHLVQEHPGVTWVWALDGDRAGRKYTRQWVERMRREGHTVAAAQIPQRGRKRDWNDLYREGRLAPEDLAEYRYHGALLISESPTEKALHIYRHDGKSRFPLEHGSRLYWFALDPDRYDKARSKAEEDGLPPDEARDTALKEAGTVTEVANCHPQFLYWQRSTATDESWYYCRVTSPGGRAVKNTFSGAQLSTAKQFKQRLLSIASGALWRGTDGQLDALLSAQVHSLRTVETVDFIGYSREHAAYIYNEVAVRGGQLVALNDEDFFELGQRHAVKPMAAGVTLAINTTREDYTTAWVDNLWRSFGAKGIVALAHWTGSLFAEQIRDATKSYPFLELVGEPGSGKTTLIEFLWKLCGRRDYEGFDPSKSTLPARARNFAQVSNLPIVLIESDREEDTAKSRRFDWEELKTAYNGRSVRSRGVKSAGNETYEPPFRGAVVIAQNHTVNASDAILQRIVHLEFTRAEHTPETKRLVEALERWPMDQLSGYLLTAVTREAQLLEHFLARAPVWEQTIMDMPDVKSVRVAKNHGQMAALVECLARILPLPEEAIGRTHDLLAEMAIERQHAINADHPVVAQFWELFEFLDGEGGAGEPRLNHSKAPDRIAVNLPHFAEEAGKHRLSIPDLITLKRHLKTSRRPKYLKQAAVESAIASTEHGAPRSVKCWVFQR